jgi:Cys-rich protein (TIGR01571 family)
MIATLPWFISANDSVHTPKCFEGYTDCIYFCDTDPDCKGNYWCTNETRRELDTCIIPLYNRTDITNEEEQLIWLMMELSIMGIFLTVFMAFTGCVCKFIGPRQKFSSPLHGCFDDMGNCLLVTWCPCVQWGRIVEWSIDDESPWWIFCLAYCLCKDFRTCFGMVTRPMVRNKLKIKGEFWEDCLIHCFTHPCALCQEARELKVDSYGIPQSNHTLSYRQTTQPVIMIPAYPLEAIQVQVQSKEIINKEETNTLEEKLV